MTVIQPLVVLDEALSDEKIVKDILTMLREYTQKGGVKIELERQFCRVRNAHLTIELERQFCRVRNAHLTIELERQFCRVRNAHLTIGRRNVIHRLSS